MKSRILLFGLFLFSIHTYGQSPVTIKAFVIDAKTEKPIEFANIGFVDKSVGTVSSKTGFFILDFDELEIGLASKLQFSTIGYETLNMTLAELYKRLKTSDVIYMTPTVYDLEEVLLIPEDRRKISLGNMNVDPERFGYWKSGKALGGEIATRIRIRKPQTQLEAFYFNVVENRSDSLLIRLNVYDYKNRYPTSNILGQNIFYTIKTKRGKVGIDLSPYNIIVDSDIVISIELIEIYGDKIEFAVSTSLDSGISHTRYVSQDTWKRHEKTSMAFVLEATYPKGSKNNKPLEREGPNKVILYWDASISGSRRDIQKELELLRRYLNTLEQVEVQAVKFWPAKQEIQRFDIKKGRSESLLTYLSKTLYDGDSDFSNVLTKTDYEAQLALVFSDGLSAVSTLENKLSLPVFAVNSHAKAKHNVLQQISNYSDGYYIDLHKMEIVQALRAMRYYIDDNVVYAQDNKLLKTNGVYGKVHDGNLPLQRALVRVIGTYNEVETDVEGNYIIEADPGDILSFSFLGTNIKQVRVTHKGELNVRLNPRGEQLDEVVLKQSVSSQELVNTPYGKQKMEQVSYAITGLKQEDITEQYTTLDQLMRKIPGVLVIGIGSEKRYVFARNSGSSVTLSTVPIIVIDNRIYIQERNIEWELPPLDVQTITNVEAIKSIVGTNRYGSLGAYGAIVITTNATNFDWAKPSQKKPSALIEGNNFNLDLPMISDQYVKPDYLVQWEKAANFDEAYRRYQELSKYPKNQKILFFLTASDFFREWDPDISYAVLSNVGLLTRQSLKSQKGYAYLLEERGYDKQALTIYKSLRERYPDLAQSYFDYARSLEQNGLIEEAYELYKEMLINTTKGVTFTAIQKDVELALRRLVKTHKSKLSYQDIPNSLLDVSFSQKVRIVFEWNDPSAQFELQFVNPQKKYFTWTLDSFTNKNRMFQGVKQGYFLESFELDESILGEWLVNIKYLGGEYIENPILMKYTIYKNFGASNETKKVKTIRLSDIEQFAILDRIML